MKSWPHAPARGFGEAGTFMVTSGTYLKEHYFNTRDRLDLLRDTLLETATEFGWELHAWSVFSNHYHFVGASPQTGSSLSTFMAKLHSLTGTRVNALDSAPGRRVWYRYWDTALTFQKSYMARLHYVHENPVRHGCAGDAVEYPWCSAYWFEQTAPTAFVRSVKSFPIDRLSVRDDYEVLLLER